MIIDRCGPAIACTKKKLLSSSPERMGALIGHLQQFYRLVELERLLGQQHELRHEPQDASARE